MVLIFAQRIVRVYLEYEPSFVLIEDVGFQAIYRREIQREASRLGVNLPYEGFKGGNKFVHIKSLQSLFETETLQVPEKALNLIDQAEKCIREEKTISWMPLRCVYHG